MANLILVRHGRSEWNEKGLWTGWTDIPLNDTGRGEARRAGDTLKNIKIDFAYSSCLVRAKETLEIILREINQKPPITENSALNERNYGSYTGKNKWQVSQEVGEEMFTKIRRSWDFPIPGGESLKMVYGRIIPYFETEILPKLIDNKNVIIVSSGNSLRSLIKYLENVSDTDITNFEIGTGEAWVYELDNKGKMISKRILAKNPVKV